MFKLITVSLCAIITVHGIVIPTSHVHRDLSTYDTGALEPYADYSTRYQELGCADQHGTDFFNDCCHPLLKGQTLQDSRKPYCTPPSSSVSASATAPTTSVDPEGSTTSAVPPPVNAAAPPPSSAAPSPTTPAASAPSPTNTGFATWFYQNNTPGACGIVHLDSAKIVALDSAIYDREYCGKTVELTNLLTGATTQATVADECPGCQTSHSLDLSQGAFQALTGGDLGLGQFKLGWRFLN